MPLAAGAVVLGARMIILKSVLVAIFLAVGVGRGGIAEENLEVLLDQGVEGRGGGIAAR